jgi:hypothetical protein
LPTSESDSEEEEKGGSKNKKKKKVLRVAQNEAKMEQCAIDMSLLQLVFAESVERFYNHKRQSD